MDIELIADRLEALAAASQDMWDAEDAEPVQDVTALIRARIDGDEPF